MSAKRTRKKVKTKRSIVKRIKRTKRTRRRRRRTRSRRPRRGGGNAGSSGEKESSRILFEPIPVVDDVAIVYITTHGKIIPNYNVSRGPSFLEGQPLFSRLTGIDVHKINAVSPGTCNFVTATDILKFASILGRIFGYDIKIDDVTSPSGNAADQILRWDTEDEKNKIRPPVDVYGDFDNAARMIGLIYKYIDVSVRNSPRASPTPMDYETEEERIADEEKQKADEEDRTVYDREQHAYKVYKMSHDTPFLNKEFSFKLSEHVKRTPYDWNITLFDSSGPRSLIQELIDANKMTTSQVLDRDDTNFQTSTTNIVSHLYSLGKRRIIFMDMTCSVMDSPSGAASLELNRNDTSGRAGLRAAHGIPNG